MVQSTFIIEAKRSPVGKFGGSLSFQPITDLASQVVKTVLKNFPITKSSFKPDEVIIGNVLSAGLGQNPARIAAIKAGLSEDTPAYCVNQVCGSGLRSILAGVQSIENGQANFIVAGGMEGMSRAPYIIDNYRFGMKFGNAEIKDTMIMDGLFCSLIGKHVALTAENIAKKFRISREEQDKYAFKSHKKSTLATKTGKFKNEIVSLRIKTEAGEIVCSQDETPREDTSLKKLSKLKPVFEENGTVTAGNAAPLSDGAAFVLLASEPLIKKHKRWPMAIVREYSQVGLDPNLMGMGAFLAAKVLLKKAGLKPSDIDLWEINEAFASQIIAVINHLDIDPLKVNVNGGAIALGHPIGASGARILTTLVHTMKNQKSKFGVATLCIGGGQGIAMLVENV